MNKLTNLLLKNRALFKTFQKLNQQQQFFQSVKFSSVEFKPKKPVELKSAQKEITQNQYSELQDQLKQLVIDLTKPRLQHQKKIRLLKQYEEILTQFQKLLPKLNQKQNSHYYRYMYILYFRSKEEKYLEILDQYIQNSLKSHLLEKISSAAKSTDLFTQQTQKENQEKNEENNKVFKVSLQGEEQIIDLLNQIILLQSQFGIRDVKNHYQVQLGRQIMILESLVNNRFKILEMITLITKKQSILRKINKNNKEFKEFDDDLAILQFKIVKRFQLIDKIEQRILNQKNENIDLVPLYTVMSIFNSICMKIKHPKMASIRSLFFTNDLKTKQDQMSEEEQNFERENLMENDYDNNNNSNNNKIDILHYNMNIRNSNLLLFQELLTLFTKLSYITQIQTNTSYKVIGFINILSISFPRYYNKQIMQNIELLVYCTDILSENLKDLNEQQITLLYYILSRFEIYQYSEKVYDKIFSNLSKQLSERYEKFTKDQLKSIFYSFGKSSLTNINTAKMLHNLLEVDQLKKMASQMKDKNSTMEISQYFKSLFLCSMNFNIINKDNFTDEHAEIIIKIIQNLQQFWKPGDNSSYYQQSIIFIYQVANGLYASYIYNNKIWETLFQHLAVDKYNEWLEYRFRFYVYLMQNTYLLFKEEIQKQNCLQLFQQLDLKCLKHESSLTNEYFTSHGFEEDYKSTLFESRIETYLKKWGKKFEVQKIIGNFSVDIYVPEDDIIIEIQGPQHYIKIFDDDGNECIDDKINTEKNWNQTTKFRIECLQRMGKKVLLISKSNHNISLERLFLREYNKLIQNSKEEKEQQKQEVQI